MALPLSPNIEKAVDRLFTGECRDEVVRLLVEQCADNLPNCEYLNEYELEDLRFQVLKLANGSIAALRDAVRLANSDWRDLMVEAGSVSRFKRAILGRELERNLCSEREMRGAVLNAVIWVVSFLLSLTVCVSGSPQSVAWILALAIAGACTGWHFVVVWRDRHSREVIGFRGCVAVALLGAITFVGVPVVLAALSVYIYRMFAG